MYLKLMNQESVYHVYPGSNEFSSGQNCSRLLLFSVPVNQMWEGWIYTVNSLEIERKPTRLGLEEDLEYHFEV